MVPFFYLTVSRLVLLEVRKVEHGTSYYGFNNPNGVSSKAPKHFISEYTIRADIEFFRAFDLRRVKEHQLDHVSELFIIESVLP